MEDRFQKFTTIISNISKYIVKIKSHEMKKQGLKTTDLTCLYYTRVLGDNVTATDISNASGEDKAAISRAVTELEKTGYIKEREGGKKKYRAIIKLTEKGVKICDLIMDKVESYVEKASKDLTDEMKSIFYTAIENIMKNLEILSKSF